MTAMGTYSRTWSAIAAVVTVCLASSNGQGQDAKPPRAFLGAPTAPIQHVAGQTEQPPATQVKLPSMPATQLESRALPINLPTALHLAGANPLDIALASQRLSIASAELQRAKVLWLPTVLMGVDYYRHDGRLQDVAGEVFNTHKSTFMVGATPNVVFAVTDAIYAPLSAKQVVRARQADLQASRNDSLLAVAEAYFNVQQARGEVAGTMDSLGRTEEMARKIEKLVEGLSPPVEKNRVLTELASRKQAVETAYERWQIASADLNRLLRLDPTTLAQPLEPPHLHVNLIDAQQSIDALITIGLTNRPELASQQALVQATLARLRQEKVRPWVPSVVIRGAATNPAGTLAGGYFGGGIDDNLSKFGGRNSIDFQLLWELQNLGFGNRALVNQRTAENQHAVLAMFRAQDTVAAEVVQAHAQATRAANRLRQAEDGVKNAAITVEKSLEGLHQARNIGGTLVLVLRPFEVIAAIQSLDQSYRSYYTAVADSNRAQFRLYRAIGQPAQCLHQELQMPAGSTPDKLPPAK